MSDQTSIEWTNWTWNPLAAFLKADHLLQLANGETKLIPAGTRGWFCTKCSPGCLNCYAEGINLRLGTGLEYKLSNLEKIEWRLVNLLRPLSKKAKPGQNRCFVNSMTDLFHESVPDGLIDQVFAAMALARHWDFQVLTKRAKRMREYFSDLPRRSAAIGRAMSVLTMQNRREGVTLPLPNVWLGVSAEDQKRWDDRVPELVQVPAAVRFVSCEPLLEDIDMSGVLWRTGCIPHCGEKCSRDINCPCEPSGLIHWIIPGGESGRQARESSLPAIASVAGQAKGAGVRVLVKQLGGNLSDEALDACARASGRSMHHPKGGDPNEWPPYLRIRDFPTPTTHHHV